MSKPIALSTPVVYTDSEGKAKAAIVIGTRASVRPGTDASRPNEGRANLLIITPNGKSYLRENVKAGEGVQRFVTAKAFAKFIATQPVVLEAVEYDEDSEDDGFDEDDNEN